VSLDGGQVVFIWSHLTLPISVTPLRGPIGASFSAIGCWPRVLEEYRMTVDSSPVKFTPALRGQMVPEIRTISGDRPVFRAQLPDGRIVWLVSGYENVRQMIVDQRFSRALAVAPGRARQGFEMFAAGSPGGPGHRKRHAFVGHLGERTGGPALCDAGSVF